MSVAEDNNDMRPDPRARFSRQGYFSEEVAPMPKDLEKYSGLESFHAIKSDCWRPYEISMVLRNRLQSLFLEKERRAQSQETDLRASGMLGSIGTSALVKIIEQVSNTGGKVRTFLASSKLKRICVFTRFDQKAEIIGPLLSTHV